MTLLTSKCASHHNNVHFFDIWTSKSGPDLWCFLPFWLENVLRVTTACTFSTSQLPKVVRGGCALCILTWKCASHHNGGAFSTSQLPKVVREWRVLYILIWKCASHHNGVHFFDISTSKSGPNPSLFYAFDLEMCFAPQWRAIFHLSSVHIVGSLTSKLPSISCEPTNIPKQKQLNDSMAHLSNKT